MSGTYVRSPANEGDVLDTLRVGCLQVFVRNPDGFNQRAYVVQWQHGGWAIVNTRSGTSWTVWSHNATGSRSIPPESGWAAATGSGSLPIFPDLYGKAPPVSAAPPVRAKTAEEIEWDRRRELIKKIFVLFDHDGTKDVVIDEFAALAKVFEGKNMTQQVAKKVFAKLDADNNGAVDEEEFIDFMMGKMGKMTRDKFDGAINLMTDRAAKARGQS